MVRFRQGQSISTIDKERQFASPMAVDMMIIAAKRPHDIYHHFDLNAGSGWNDDYGVKGTPMVFTDLAQQYLNKWQAMFFEIEQARARELYNRTCMYPQCKVEAIDNRHFMEWAGKLPSSAVGTILTDPNGWLYRSAQGIGTPVTELIEACRRLPSIDLIANLNARTYMLMKGDIKCHPEKEGYSRLYSLAEMPDLFHKRYGLVSNLSSNGHGQFVRFILRNIKTGDHKALGWNLWDSPKAKEIFNYLDGVGEEPKEKKVEHCGQLYLFEEMTHEHNSETRKSHGRSRIRKAG